MSPRVVSGESNVATYVHVDNIRFYGEKEEVTRAADNLQNLLAQVNMSADEEDFSKFLGVAYDYPSATVTATRESLDKLEAAWSANLPLRDKQ